MNRSIAALVLAAVLAAGTVNSAEACYCGWRSAPRVAKRLAAVPCRSSAAPL